jgi:hypothetical protein
LAASPAKPHRDNNFTAFYETTKADGFNRFFREAQDLRFNSVIFDAKPMVYFG